MERACINYFNSVAGDMPVGVAKSCFISVSNKLSFYAGKNGSHDYSCPVIFK